MENFVYKKEIFIYEKKNSIINELCDDIIEIYEKNVKKYDKDFMANDSLLDMFNTLDNHEKNFSKILNETTKDNENNLFYNLNFDDENIRIKNYLIIELKKNLNIFFNNFKNKTLIKKKNNYNNDYTLINIKDINPDFTIKKTEYLNQEDSIEIESRYLKSSTNGVKIFMYIWFLNNYCGDFIFWNNYKINNKKGTLLIFPISWCFPYKELVKLYEKRYIIYGYLYNS